MNLSQFQQATEKLQALPEGQVLRALQIAGGLTDPLKDDLLQELTVLNEQMSDARKQEEGAITELEHLVLDADREMRTLERTEAESSEQATSLKAAESKLKRKS
ncbi:MAG: hypothetical protein Q7S29_02350 [Candidatus Peribacter sp.]|nr:hypothetical protein [Candidatus Peribacter sp.]